MCKPCCICDFEAFQTSVPKLFETTGVATVLGQQSRVVIKPNLVNLSAPPVTLPVDAARAIISFCRQHSDAEIIVAEGTGEPDITTWDVFREHGYDDLASEFGLELIDLNNADLVELKNGQCSVFPVFMMPEVLMDSFVISAATLKAHSLARVTLSMKNMIGAAPPEHYQRGGYWRKSAFHHQMQTSIYELNRYRKPDFSFIDGSIGLADHHLGGPVCEPPVCKLIAGADPVAVDACGAELLGIPWAQVGHIKMADNDLGNAELRAQNDG